MDNWLREAIVNPLFDPEESITLDTRMGVLRGKLRGPFELDEAPGVSVWRIEG